MIISTSIMGEKSILPSKFFKTLNNELTNQDLIPRLQKIKSTCTIK